MENRRERFKRLASKRTTNVLNQLRVLSNLSDRNNYDYTDDDVKRIFNAIEDQLHIIKAKFQSKIRKEFKL